MALPDPDLHQTEFLNQLAWSRRWSDRAQSGGAAVQALDLAGGAATPSDRRGAGLALRTLAWQCKWRGDLAGARRRADAALALLEGTGSHASMADADSILGVVHYSRGRNDLARETVKRGFARLEDENRVETRIDLLTTLSTVMRYNGRSGEACGCLGEALALARRGERARVLHNLARFHLSTGSLADALAAALGSVASARRWENVVVLPYALEVIGTIHLREKRHDRAGECLTEALAIARRDTDSRVECQTVEQLGVLALELGDRAGAIRVLEEGRALAARMGYTLWQKNFCMDLARAYEAAGDLERALAALKTLNGLRENQVA